MSFQAAVEREISTWKGTILRSPKFGTSYAGENFAIVAYKAPLALLWKFELYLFLDHDPRFKGTIFDSSGGLSATCNWEFKTEEECLTAIETGDKSMYAALTSSPVDWKRLRVRLPEDTLEQYIVEGTWKPPNGMQSLQKGDHVSIRRKGYFHEGIYIGDGQIIHIFGEDGKKSMGARKDPWSVFLANSTEYFVICYRIRVRPPEEIVRIAEDFARNEFRKGAYNLAASNCQHFASLCAVNHEMSPDVAVFTDPLIHHDRPF